MANSFSNPKIVGAKLLPVLGSRNLASKISLIGSGSRPNNARIVPGVHPNPTKTPHKISINDGLMREVAQQTPKLSGATRKLVRGYQSSPARLLPKPRTLRSLALGVNSH